MNWTDTEVDFLLANRGCLTWAEMGRRLGRSGPACQQKVLHVERTMNVATEPWPEGVVFHDHPDADRVGRRVLIPLRNSMRAA